MTAPLHSLRAHQFSHQSAAAVSKPKLVSNEFIRRVPTAKHSHHKSLEENLTALQPKMIGNPGVRAPLLRTSDLKGGVAILERHSDVNQEYRLRVVVDRFEV